MQEFDACVKELTTNRTYYLAYFLDDTPFNPTEEHVSATEIPDNYVVTKEEEVESK